MAADGRRVRGWWERRGRQSHLRLAEFSIDDGFSHSTTYIRDLKTFSSSFPCNVDLLHFGYESFIFSRFFSLSMELSRNNITKFYWSIFTYRSCKNALDAHSTPSRKMNFSLIYDDTRTSFGKHLDNMILSPTTPFWHFFPPPFFIRWEIHLIPLLFVSKALKTPERPSRLTEKMKFLWREKSLTLEILNSRKSNDHFAIMEIPLVSLQQRLSSFFFSQFHRFNLLTAVFT